MTTDDGTNNAQLSYVSVVLMLHYRDNGIRMAFYFQVVSPAS